MEIQAHHRRAIDRLVTEYQSDPRFSALIIGGSVAKACARPDSDVDFLIVATDDEFTQRRAQNDLFINRTDLCDYEGGYVDGKIISHSFLEELADKGNEPSRAAFEGAFAAFSHLPDLVALLNNICVYPEHDRDRRIKAFYTMAFMQHWLINESLRHGNRYTITRAASQLALFSGRLILAHNRTLFPYHKWLTRALESVEDKPDKMLSHIDALLENPDAKNANALFQSVRDFRDWGVSDIEAYTWFMTEVEWAWMSGTTPIEDW
jgi:hypothetical protein